MISRLLALAVLSFLLAAPAPAALPPPHAYDVGESYSVREILAKCEKRHIALPWSNLTISVIRSAVDYYHGAKNIYLVSIGTRAGRGTKWLVRGAVEWDDGVVVWLDDLRPRAPTSKPR